MEASVVVAPCPPKLGMRFASAYALVSSKSLRRYERAAWATATRPVYRRCPIISIVRVPLTFWT